VVYVVGFLCPGNSGGFEWRETASEAELEQEWWSSHADELVSAVRLIEVPASLSDCEVTDWLDARPELWEPGRPLGEGVQGAVV
jgi:hypothetical protein